MEDELVVQVSPLLQVHLGPDELNTFPLLPPLTDAIWLSCNFAIESLFNFRAFVN